MMEVLLGFLCVCVAAAILADSVKRTHGMDLRMRRERNAILSAAVSAAVLILYPLIFHKLVGFEGIAMFGFLWTYVMILYDGYQQPESREDDQAALYNTSNAANVVIGACWATGSLIHAISNRGMNSKGARILLISLVLCVSFVLSTHAKHDRSETSVVVRTVQRNILHVAVGLFISGILISCE